MSETATQSSDRLLWLAAGVVVCMGLAWLVIEAPWSANDDPGDFASVDVTAGPVPASAAGPRTATPASTAAGAAAVTDAAANGAGATDAAATEPAPAAADTDPLYLARLALDAGMLMEPADYSAWTLFGAAAARDPDDAAAREGLEQVAAALLGRGRTALEQGRFDDATRMADTIAERLPEHAGALALAADIVVATTPPPEPVAPPAPVVRAPVAAAPEPVDPIPGRHAAFRDALVQNAILTPQGESARDIVGEMLAMSPEHELTLAARDLLVTEMLDRSAQSIEALDTAAARTWIDAATGLAAGAGAIARAEARLTAHLRAQESQKLVPASELTRVSYTPPHYPEMALTRGIEGWVEIGFVVAPDGSTTEVTVLDASHDLYFDEAAAAAVGEWRFEPVEFMGEAIARRSFTRLEFVLN
jgi:TonB family protein